MAAKTYWFESKLDNGTPVTVEYQVLGAEPDVGLMSDYPEIVSVADAAGVQRDTTDTEDDRLFDEACKHMDGLESGDDY